jgi:hypothetical protein
LTAFSLCCSKEEEGEQIQASQTEAFCKEARAWALTAATPVGVMTVNDTYLSSDNVADLHQMVVYNVCQVIGWVTIVLHDNLIVNVLVVEHNLAVNDVLKLSLTLRYFHPDDVALTTSLAFFDFLWRQL